MQELLDQLLAKLIRQNINVTVKTINSLKAVIVKDAVDIDISQNKNGIIFVNNNIISKNLNDVVKVLSVIQKPKVQIKVNETAKEIETDLAVKEFKEQMTVASNGKAIGFNSIGKGKDKRIKFSFEDTYFTAIINQDKTFSLGKSGSNKEVGTYEMKDDGYKKCVSDLKNYNLMDV